MRWSDKSNGMDALGSWPAEPVATRPSTAPIGRASGVRLSRVRLAREVAAAGREFALRNGNSAPPWSVLRGRGRT